ncbi:MAG TPA: hypothetical protein VN441_00205 [Syntrophomonas sp.]|nr:hypothetical protein [Syntrophomonas sp.]
MNTTYRYSNIDIKVSIRCRAQTAPAGILPEPEKSARDAYPDGADTEK